MRVIKNTLFKELFRGEKHLVWLKISPGSPVQVLFSFNLQKPENHVSISVKDISLSNFETKMEYGGVRTLSYSSHLIGFLK